MQSTSHQPAVQSTSKTFNLKELFTDNFFSIPDYQRGYSWEQQHLVDLIKDIENISQSNHKHYTGTIVAARLNNKENYYELVDGQQRLTTLVILMNEFYHFDPVLFKEVKSIFLFRGSIGNEVPVFVPNVETRSCFNLAILERKSFQPTIKSHQSILDASQIFREWLITNKDNTVGLYETIINQLSFLFFTPEHDKEIGIMFEVINNRGKELSELEKIKNFFIYYATVHDKQKLREDINTLWVSIQTNLSQSQRISNDDEKAFLRYCYLVFFKTTKEKSWNVYDECKLEFDVKDKDPAFIDSVIKRMRAFITFLADASLSYSWFFNANYFQNNYRGEEKEQIQKCLTYLRCQPTFASIMPLYLAIMSRIIQPVKVVRLLKILEILNMRLYIIPGVLTRADSKQADLFWFAHDFYNDPDWESNSEPTPLLTRYNEVEIKGDVFDWLYQNMIQITYKYCDAQKLEDGLVLNDNENKNYYRWQGIRYFLACYEEDLRKSGKRSFDIHRILSGRKMVGENLNDQLSLEHIWASQNMVDDFPEDYYTKRRLGNFVLCGLSSNITLSKESIPDKLDILLRYNSAGEGALDMFQVSKLVKVLAHVREELGNKRQTKNYRRDLANMLCDEREEDLIKFAFKRWSLPNEKALKK